MKLSFKNGARPTGLSSVGNPYRSITIKGDGKDVGSIRMNNSNAANPKGDNKYHIWLHVKTEDSFKNITLKAKFDTENDAKNFITEHWQSLIERYPIHQIT